MTKGWRQESARHALASKGFKTGTKPTSKEYNLPKEPEGYQGWTNRATWAFNLWITNTEGDYRYWQEEARNSDSSEELAKRMKDYLEDLQNEIVERPEETTREARLMISDIGDIHDIDYYEVAEGFYKEAKEGD